MMITCRKGFKWLKRSLNSRMRDYFRSELVQLEMGLEDRMKENLAMFSGGQRQARREFRVGNLYINRFCGKTTLSAQLQVLFCRPQKTTLSAVLPEAATPAGLPQPAARRKKPMPFLPPPG